MGDKAPGSGSRIPSLRRLHDTVHASGSAKWSLEYHRRKTTEEIVASLLPRAILPLLVKPDGTVMQGNTRIKVLQERGYPVDELERGPF